MSGGSPEDLPGDMSDPGAGDLGDADLGNGDFAEDFEPQSVADLSSSAASVETDPDPEASEAQGLEGLADGLAERRSHTDRRQAGQSGQASQDGQPAADGSANASQEPMTVEDLVEDLVRVSTERDQLRDSMMRLQAEFENYRKAVAKREVEARERANESFATELLPVLDACEGAVKNGAADVEPISTQLTQALNRQGLEKLDPADAIFDPEQHDAVMHEPSDDVDVPTVAEVLRAGYSLKGRTIRPAMVKVKG